MQSAMNSYGSAWGKSTGPSGPSATASGPMVGRGLTKNEMREAVIRPPAPIVVGPSPDGPPSTLAMLAPLGMLAAVAIAAYWFFFRRGRR